MAETDELNKLLADYRSGYLNEQTLERAVINIAKYHSRHQREAVQEWLIAGLLLLGAIVWWKLSPSATPTQPTTAKVATSEKVPPLSIATPNLLDDSPPGSYDFTLIGQEDTTAVPVPAPCAGKVTQVWFQGRTGNLATGVGAGNIVKLACPPYGWLLGHLREPLVQPEQWVQLGQAIGVQGCTGRCSADHVHLQIHALPSWERIENRAITAPLVDQYFARVRRGTS
jgi:murein DD-endopeptidase MepM/ murein hydrolase activator NlpD